MSPPSPVRQIVGGGPRRDPRRESNPGSALIAASAHQRAYGRVRCVGVVRWPLLVFVAACGCVCLVGRVNQCAKCTPSTLNFSSRQALPGLCHQKAGACIIHPAETNKSFNGDGSNDKLWSCGNCPVTEKKQPKLSVVQVGCPMYSALI
eukprot:Opistho-2@79504